MKKTETNKKTKLIKKVLYIIILITFIPSAIYFLVTGKLGHFFIIAILAWIIIQIGNKYL